MWVGEVPEGTIREVVFSSDSRALYTVSDNNRIDAWDLVTHAGRMLVPANDPAPGGDVGVSPDGKHLRIASLRSLVVRDSTTGSVISRIDRTESLESSRQTRDAKYVWGFDFRSKEWWRWDWAAGKSFKSGAWQWPDDLGRPSCWSTALHPDGQTLAVGEQGPAVVLFDFDTGAEISRLVGSRKAPLPTEKRLGFSLDGSRLVVFGDGGYLAAFEWPTGQLLWEQTPGGRTRYVYDLAFHPSGTVVAYTAGVPPKEWGSVAWFGDMNTGEPVVMPHPGFKAAACIAFSPDGLTCAVGGSNKQFAVFDVDI